MGCLESLKYEVILQGASFKECREYVRTRCKEHYDVDPGFRIFGKAVIGVPPISIGLDGDTITFPYTKPCYGTFLVQVRDPGEADLIRRTAPAKKK
ncbi:MAG TPA: DUF1894 domain-containing protein [Methanoregulaceae archaeon]|nr:MAG: DUF1894 domain-containing protein [Methanolinea sp.]HON81720.1 DUF1894 domain-containing protein [Methanoregulaceae archaeon]HPD10473.1 DUF1894 domain-containing protein [Methanoregulaceae archaeon]HRT15492.1 DUF1894 domain-containing protein [Methanoregulaceae archaeon]HRU31118.1 DUF1894 domain-containing protein [Methanoregulaceae archaeon]